MATNKKSDSKEKKEGSKSPSKAKKSTATKAKQSGEESPGSRIFSGNSPPGQEGPEASSQTRPIDGEDLSFHQR